MNEMFDIFDFLEEEKKPAKKCIVCGGTEADFVADSDVCIDCKAEFEADQEAQSQVASPEVVDSFSPTFEKEQPDNPAADKSEQEIPATANDDEPVQDDDLEESDDDEDEKPVKKGKTSKSKKSEAAADKKANKPTPATTEPPKPKSWVYPFTLHYAGQNRDTDHIFENGKEYTAEEITKSMLNHQYYEFAGKVEYDYIKADNVLVPIFQQHRKG